MELTLRVNAERGTTVIRLFKDRASPASHKEFACTVLFQDREYRADIPAAELQDLLGAVRSARVSPVGDCGFGLDGVSYELTIEEGMAHATYRWWMTPGEGWSPLADIADRILQLGFRVS